MQKLSFVVDQLVNFPLENDYCKHQCKITIVENCVKSENMTLIQRQHMFHMDQACLDTISLQYFYRVSTAVSQETATEIQPQVRCA